MMDGMMGSGMMAWMLLWGLVGLALLVLLIAGIVWVVRWGFSSTQARSSERAIELLKERYARGEISKEEYEEKKRDLAA
ncbi:SHOCT domain-containing protein [Candidatus Manganitrophus noduliformans]|uniref:SHOCT domain-containing protein n=1 Tax=Candidatus Manganitrophus noduliformans TaxID=2606439 RepID=A0A7X6DN16_9BACT|nr:SHOCT domain-containing protein [Candidatus Manganitrophus noduliformans]NKE70243.1 hypothetical protein [Candidatus Manganitrophus noduliformans]